MRKRELTLDEEVVSYHFKYNIPEEEIRKAREDFRSGDVDKACLLAVLSGKKLSDILEMRKELPWGLIQKELGLTGDVYDEKYFHHRANRLHRFYGINEERAYALLSAGYPNHWIRLAWLLETHGHGKVEDILKEKKKSERWKPLAERMFHVKPEDFTLWIGETRNPSLPPKK